MYAKVYSQLFDSSLRDKWQGWVTFVALLVLADANDEVDMTLLALASRTGLPGAVVEEGIRILEQPDIHSRTPDEEGRRIVRLDDHRPWGWRIVNRGKYKRLRDNESRREYFREQKKAKRAGTPLSTTCPPVSTTVHPCPPQTVDSRQETRDIESTPSSASASERPVRARRSTKPDTPGDVDWRKAFWEFFWPDWLALGRPCSRAAALSAWMGVPHPDPQEDFTRLDTEFKKALKFWAENGTQTKFIPHASKWLNDYRKDTELEAQ